jgi:hypothetical protein
MPKWFRHGAIFFAAGAGPVSAPDSPSARFAIGQIRHRIACAAKLAATGPPGGESGESKNVSNN